jgi:sulfatase modifying factor 1
VGARRLVTRARTLAGSSALGLASACAGDSFQLADDAASQGGSEFPPLSTTDNAGSGGSGGASSEPVVSPCGELRPGTGGDDAEVCLPAGMFTMGSTEASVPSGYTVHGPAHTVTLPAFVLDANEVTVARYRGCVSAGSCTAPRSSADQGCTYSAASGSADRFPVTCVSWDDAVLFCAWDGGRRLPTEAEWERAARGTVGRTYAWGDEVACTNAVFGGLVQCPQHGGSLPKPVGSTPLGASPEGVLDLTGNAWEWVHDWFGPYASEAADNPTGPNQGSTRIQRGGNWQTPPANATAFMRRAEAPAAIGPSSFRCARSVL